MTRKKSKQHTAADPLEAVEEALERFPEDPSQLSAARDGFREIAGSAREAERPDLEQLADSMGHLLELAETQLADCEDGVDPKVAGILGTVREGIAPLRSAICDTEDVTESIQRILESIQAEWGEYLSLIEPDGTGPLESDAWNDGEPTDDSWNAGEGDFSGEESRENIDRILETLNNSPADADHTPNADDAPRSGPDPGASPQAATCGVSGSAMFNETHDGLPEAPPAPVRIDMNPSLLEAYLEDASSCVGRLEQLVLGLETNPSDADAHRSICRELHTLKGASASVGLSELAAYLHRVEDYVQASTGGVVDVRPMLGSVDAVRGQIALLSAADPGTSDSSARVGASAGSIAGYGDTRREESLRVKASRVDRLMDLLAELVTLRNRRDSRLARLKDLRAELTRCVTRLRVFAGGFGTDLPGGRRSAEVDRGGQSGGSDGESSAPESAVRSNYLLEIASDIFEFARTLGEVAEPMETENVAVSQFIRQFRQELMEMRRLPVSGLFQRLNRAAQDAARTEGKKIEFVLEGEHSGLDRSLQERLYEPLLHMVRNAVSHGIEPEAARRNAGKSPTGRITLSAKGSPTTLIIEIADDGRGLDYDAIRRRAVEKGLITSGEYAEESRLARLIFHPGFSTRQEANEISGRGVGMDVVAAALQRMRARIDVESRAGAGTTMRLTIPLRSVIEHAMVVRAGGGLYALPMQFVQAAGPRNSSETPEGANAGTTPGSDATGIRLRDLLGGYGGPEVENEHEVILGSGRLSLAALAESSNGHRAAGRSAERRQRLVVDAVVGPEEIVVRSLPPLLKTHPLLGGISLSGAGEIVLMLDGQRLMEPSTAQRNADGRDEPDGDGPLHDARSAATAMLVVDDSVSARRRLANVLKQFGFNVAEAGDGQQGLDRIRNGRFALVFSDIEMPERDGFELLQEIKSEQNGGTRVVMVSSRTEDKYRQRAEELGCDGYLVKPVDEAAVAGLLTSLGFSI